MANLKNTQSLLDGLMLLFWASNLKFASSSSTNPSQPSATTSPTSSASVILPSTTTASADSTFFASSSPSTLIPEEPEYSFTYPSASSWVDTQVNYKDTIELYWSQSYPYNDPALSIHCWHRNATADDGSDIPLFLHRSPDLIESIVLDPPISRFHVVNMTNYKIYNPCQFFLVDSINATLTRGVVASAGIAISINDKVAAKSWSVADEAPVSSALPTSGTKKTIGGERVLALAAAWGLVLLAFGMSLM